jgi:uncharacterized protein YbjQ (UPF0145 family)
MQVSYGNELEDRRAHCTIGQIRASSEWCAASPSAEETGRTAAVQALIREAQEYGADAIIRLNFEIDDIQRADFDGTRLRRVAATGIAVKFAETP